jgi:hypothetical protein
MPTEKYPGVLVFFVVCSLSPNHVCKLNTNDAHPTNRFRVSIAAMGIVDAMLDENSTASGRGRDSWYGTTASDVC